MPACGENPAPATVTSCRGAKPVEGVTVTVGCGGSGTDVSNANGADPGPTPWVRATTAHSPGFSPQSYTSSGTAIRRRTSNTVAILPLASACAPTIGPGPFG